MAQKISKKKKVSAAIAAVLAVAVAVGGAYAWTDYTQNARNTFNVEAQAEVLLHDDFDGENKDVYVENTGSTEVYVRVKFVEYFQIGTESMLPEFDEDGARPTTKADPDDVTTWPTHRFDGTNVANREVCDLVSHHDYFDWVMSGEKKEYLSNIKDFTTLDGSVKSQFDTMNIGDTIQINDVTATKKETLPQTSMMLLSTWLQMSDKPEEPCWLLDTDGWAYWSAPLMAGEATNLLLDEVITSDRGFYDNAVYHIDVQLQAATLNDLGKWDDDGVKDVANPDNDIATVTTNGYNYILYMTGASTTYSYQLYDKNVYQEVAIDSISGSVTPTGNYQLGGNDQNLNTTDDNNMLCGRSLANRGGIEIANINVTDWTYAIKGISGDYYVTTGKDGLLGTYDDIINSKSGALGMYNIDNTAGNEMMGWNYLYGPLDNMLVATEYVLDNVKFRNVTSLNGNLYPYANSDVKTTMDTLWTTWGANMTVKVNSVDGQKGAGGGLLDMSSAQHTGQWVYVCPSSHNHSVTSDTCSGRYIFTNYYTNTAAQADINLGNTKFFSLSLNEIITAYGESSWDDANTDPVVLSNRAARAADKWADNDTTYTDGKNGIYTAYGVTTAHYWLRSPGYCGSRAANVYAAGTLGAGINAYYGDVGVRPACYIDLTSQ